MAMNRMFGFSAAGRSARREPGRGRHEQPQHANRPGVASHHRYRFPSRVFHFGGIAARCQTAIPAILVRSRGACNRRARINRDARAPSSRLRRARPGRSNDWSASPAALDIVFFLSAGLVPGGATIGQLASPPLAIVFSCSPLGLSQGKPRVPVTASSSPAVRAADRPRESFRSGQNLSRWPRRPDSRCGRRLPSWRASRCASNRRPEPGWRLPSAASGAVAQGRASMRTRPFVR